jgi:hypothetical protein
MCSVSFLNLLCVPLPCGIMCADSYDVDSVKMRRRAHCVDHSASADIVACVAALARELCRAGMRCCVAVQERQEHADAAGADDSTTRDATSPSVATLASVAATAAAAARGQDGARGGSLDDAADASTHATTGASTSGGGPAADSSSRGGVGGRSEEEALPWPHAVLDGAVPPPEDGMQLLVRRTTRTYL